jgi:uncharacterized lipoprotein YbaY
MQRVRQTLGLFILVAAALGLGGCTFVVQDIAPTPEPPATDSATNAATDATTDSVAWSGVLTGTVTYVEDEALPPGSVINVQLQDVSKMDVAAEVIATQVITTSGETVPIPFTLVYDPAQIEPRFTYALSVRITIDDQLRWINTSRIEVLTRDRPLTDIEVVVDAVP